MKKLLFFQVGTMQFGLDLHLISSIQPLQQNAVEQPETNQRGRQNFDDRETELCDLFSLFDKTPNCSVADSRKIIMVKVDGSLLGMIVDRVDRVVAVDGNRFELLAPIFDGPAMSCFPGVLSYDGSLYLILNPAGIERVKRQRSEFSVTRIKASGRRQHLNPSRRRIGTADRKTQMPFSDYSSSRSTVQPLAIDLNSKVQQCM